MTDAPQMPSFNFSGITMSDDELQKELDKSNANFFQPGKHEVAVKQVEYTGLAKTDPTWVQFKLTLEGSGQKEQLAFLQVPTGSNLKYKGQKGETMYPFKTLKSFCSALGVDLKASNIAQVLPKMFGSTDALKGQQLQIEVGYRKGYAKFIKKDGDNAIYNLILADGNAQVGADKKPLEFGNREAVEQYAESQGIAYEKFASILSFNPSATPSNFMESISDAGW